MSCRRLIVVLCGLIASIPEFSLGQSPHRRFEYKYSFKSPYLAQKDNQVPFWTYSGNAIASSESLRITPSLRSQKGQAWCKQPTSFEWWEVEIVFRINGRGRVGADGLAFWFTTAHGVEGPVFGSSDKWNGLGIFFDSFDNDNKRNNPYVMAMINDGTKAYDHENDGMSQLLGGCLRDFRNKPHPVRAKIEYYKHVLTVKIQNLNLDALGLEDAVGADMYSLYHTDPSSMGQPLHPSLLYKFSTNQTSTSQDSESHGSFFGSWFADAQELEPRSPDYDSESAYVNEDLDYVPGMGVVSDAGATDVIDEEVVAVDGTRSLYSSINEAGNVDNVASNSDKPSSGWFGGEETPTTSESLTADSKDVSNAAKLSRAKKLRRKRRLERRRRRKIATKHSKLSKTKPSLMVHNGLTAGDKDYEICTRVEGVHLPTSGYFGLSAATGGLADDHDVLKFLVSSLRSPDELAAAASTDKEQEEQYQREFQQYQEKTQRARDEYVAANPDARKQHVDEDDEYEAADIRELRQIFTGQSQIYDAMRQLNAKMDEIIGRQERTLSLVGAVHSGLAVAGGGVPLPTGGAAPPPPAVGGASPISRFEVDSLINTQRDIAQTAKDVKNMVVDISQKSTQLLNKAGQPVGSAQPVGGAYDMHVTLKELNEGLNHIKHTLSAPGGQQQRGGVVEACPSCLSTWLFVGVALSQLICIIGYMMYRDNRDAQAKKFY
ncbi:protein ERGIC-53 isoform X1 [Hyalella azteca]|uniref:Protein ERGIC-53 isoform X1 n=1 Tax=Hyalella azteca TaxID=294128 RepID=A0A8B7NX69_HYAAZ|nr:protein ERGIC-53 isoform X1 [Hyalella azteca]